jgi:urease
VAWAQMGDPNASIPTVEPTIMRPMFGAHLPALSIAWVSKAGAEGKVKGYGLKKRVEAVKGCRTVKKSDMKFNDYRPKMKVDPETYVSFFPHLLPNFGPTYLEIYADFDCRPWKPTA